MHHPSTFSISYDEAITDCQIDQTYNSFCKYALGISKYTSSTFKLRELSKFPLSHTAIVIALPYWLRMEHETENVLLNKAFNTMERENHPRLQNLYFCVCVCVFVYKRHNFFLFKKYILHVLVISGTRSWKQHMHTIFSADILYSINCLHFIYKANVFRPSEMIQQQGEALKSFIPSLIWAYLFFNIDFLF